MEPKRRVQKAPALPRRASAVLCPAAPLQASGEDLHLLRCLPVPLAFGDGDSLPVGG